MPSTSELNALLYPSDRSPAVSPILLSLTMLGGLFFITRDRPDDGSHNLHLELASGADRDAGADGPSDRPPGRNGRQSGAVGEGSVEETSGGAGSIGWATG